MALLKATIALNYNGQDMVNALWYATQPDNPVGIDYIAAARALGEWVRDNIVIGAVGQSRMVDLVAKNVNFRAVEVMAYNPPGLGSINPVEIINAPQVTSVNVISSALNDDPLAPQACYILRLLCPRATVNPLDYTPAGGYIAIGPVPRDRIFGGGSLTQAALTGLSNFSAALLGQASLGSGFLANPVRVGVSKKDRLPPGVFGWAQITSATPSNLVSWRRSRTPA